MAGKYLKSLVTGVVLPYNEPALKSADIRLMEPAECEEYEASLNVATKPEPVVEPEPVEPEPVPEPEPVVEEPALAETPDEVDELVKALEVD